MLYIFWILHQTTTLYLLYIYSLSCIFFESYIKPQLSRNTGNTTRSSISFESYIKPQPTCQRIRMGTVVYLLNPTSNHNLVFLLIWLTRLYIFWILHQTTTPYPGGRISTCCISFESYIKPQRSLFFLRAYNVVYLLNPTSNHNFFAVPNGGKRVVYLLNPTSNHNLQALHSVDGLLYIFWILHQTTTDWQLEDGVAELYIFWILHQTTTSTATFRKTGELYIFWILHQTTTVPSTGMSNSGCISFESYIKPQPRSWLAK